MELLKNINEEIKSSLEKVIEKNHLEYFVEKIKFLINE